MKFDNENVALPGDPTMLSGALASRSSSGSRSNPSVLTVPSVEPVDPKLRFELNASSRSEESSQCSEDNIAQDVQAAGGKIRGRSSSHKIKAGDRIEPHDRALLEWTDI